MAIVYDPLDLSVPLHTFDRERMPPLPWPVVDNSVWRASDGSVTVVLINHTNEAHVAAVDFARVPEWSAKANAYRLGKGVETRLRGRSAKMEIPPLTMMALQFRKG